MEVRVKTRKIAFLYEVQAKKSKILYFCCPELGA